jgi:plastocyanin
MKKRFLFAALAVLGFSRVNAATITINNSGFTFSPSTANCTTADEIVFNISGSHNAVEVSEATWNANGSAALSGGFSLNFGGGTLAAGSLSVGTHYYVCSPHASAGMKGKLVVSGGSSGSTFTINNAGLTFTPAEITISTNDAVVFSISGSHNAVEVSEATWSSGGSTALPGGFSLGFGGGNLAAGSLSVGTHYYVCSPHASAGMKGKIIVQSTTGVSAEKATLQLTIFPNPVSEQLFLKNAVNLAGNSYRISSLDGREVQKGSIPSGSAAISISDLKPGSYLFLMEDGSEVRTIRFEKK